MEALHQIETEPAAPRIKPVAQRQDEQFQFLPIDWLRPSKTNPRKHFGDLTEMIASVRAHGVLVPLIVRALWPANTSDTLYEIVAGERRYRASKEAGLEQLPVRILELDDKQTLELQMIENLQRADVHPMEEADGYQALIDKHGYTVEGLAARVGKSESYVYQRLKLASLIPKAKEAFYDEKITASHAVAIARLDTPAKQKQAIDYATQPHHPPNAREFQEWIHREFYLDLHSAPFKKDDEDLLPKAGACLTCPKRSGFTPALFPELAKGRDLCQDAKCFHAKMGAHIERELQADPELVPLGPAYLSTAELKQLKGKFPKLRQINHWEIGKKSAPGARPGIIVGEIHGAELGHRVWFARPTPQTAGEDAGMKRYRAQQKKRELAREAKIYARQKLAEKILAEVPPVAAERELRIVAKAFFADIWSDLAKKIATRHGIQPGKTAGGGRGQQINKLMAARIDTWGQENLTPFLIELAIAKGTQVGAYDDGDAADLTAAAAAYQVNSKSVLAAASAEWKRQQQAKEAKKKTKAAKKAKPAAKAKGANKPAAKAKKKGGAPRAPKPKAAAATA